MASSLTKTMFLFLSILALANRCWGATYTVPWTTGANLTVYPLGKTFYVNDTLIFSYSYGTSNVYKVDLVGYAGCDQTRGTSLGGDGHTVFTLPNTGLFYFMGFNVQCLAGLRLAIEVKLRPTV